MCLESNDFGVIGIVALIQSYLKTYVILEFIKLQKYILKSKFVITLIYLSWFKCLGMFEGFAPNIVLKPRSNEDFYGPNNYELLSIQINERTS